MMMATHIHGLYGREKGVYCACCTKNRAKFVNYELIFNMKKFQLICKTTIIVDYSYYMLIAIWTLHFSIQIDLQL